jgi:NitT/TauT family transport system substrate-binding protein
MTKRITNEYGQAIFNLPWLVAQDEGLFAAEGIEVSFIRGRERDPNLPPETDPKQVDPFWRHGLFEEGEVQSFQACEWGQIRRSYDSCSGGRVVMQRPAVVSHAIFVRPDSPITEPKDLRDKTGSSTVGRSRPSTSAKGRRAIRRCWTAASTPARSWSPTSPSLRSRAAS